MEKKHTLEVTYSQASGLILSAHSKCYMFLHAATHIFCILRREPFLQILQILMTESAKQQSAYHEELKKRDQSAYQKGAEKEVYGTCNDNVSETMSMYKAYMPSSRSLSSSSIRRQWLYYRPFFWVL